MDFLIDSFWSFMDHMSVIFCHEIFSPNLNFALINIWVIRWSFWGHLWSLKIQHRLICQLNVDKGTPDKVSEYGNLSTFCWIVPLNWEFSNFWKIPSNSLTLSYHLVLNWPVQLGIFQILENSLKLSLAHYSWGKSLILILSTCA